MKKSATLDLSENNYAINHICTAVRDKIDNFIKENTLHNCSLALTIERYIKNATCGNLQDRKNFKNFIKEQFLTALELDRNLTVDFGKHPELLNRIIPFTNPQTISVRDKFTILLHKYGSENEDGYHTGFHNFKNKNSYIHAAGLTKKGLPKNKWNEYTADEIHRIYYMDKPILSIDDKVDVIVQRIYEEVYGLGCIDMLAYSNINEIGFSNDGKYIYVWDDEKIHLSFLHMSYGEAMIIQGRCISYDSKNGQLCTSTPEIHCSRADNARIVATQHPFTSSRNLCIRIFNKRGVQCNDIFTDEWLKLLIKTLIRSGEKICLQGSLGSGKTTTMQTLLQLVDDSLHIGTIEDYFEQHNALMYDNKRIVEIQQLENKSLLDTAMSLFRMSVDIASLGEARNGDAVFTFLQLAQAIDQSAMFTCHVATPNDTVPRLKNMLISTGLYTSENAAVMDIVNYINIIFQHEIVGKRRCITKIVEIVPIEAPIIAKNLKNMESPELKKVALIQQIQQDTNYLYYLNPIMELRNGQYSFLNYPSKRLIEKAEKNESSRELMDELLLLIKSNLVCDGEENVK